MISLFKIKDKALRSREKLITEIATAGDDKAYQLESDGVIVAFPAYGKYEVVKGSLSIMTYTKIIFPGQETFLQSFDVLKLDRDSNEKYVFLCAVVAKGEEENAVTIMPYFVNPVMDVHQGKSADLKTVVLNAKDFSPSEEVK